MQEVHSGRGREQYNFPQAYMRLQWSLKIRLAALWPSVQ